MTINRIDVGKGKYVKTHILTFKNVDVFVQRDKDDNVLAIEIDDRVG